MSHFGDVETKLSEHVVDDIVHYVQNGHMSDQNMKDFAQQLGKVRNDPNVANILLGNHMTRMERDRNRDKSAEMRAILSDWWRQELHDMTTDDALKKLIKIFNNGQLQFKDLAKKLGQYLPSPTPSTCAPPTAPATIGSSPDFNLKVPPNCR